MKIKVLPLFLLYTSLMLADTIINFDDLTTTQTWVSTPNAWSVIPASYDGFSWNGWEVMNDSAYNAIFADPTPIPSNPNFAYSGADSSPLSISSTVPFVFMGTQLAGWPDTNDPSATSVTIDGYLGTSFVGSTTVTFSTNTTWISSGGISGAVDTLIFQPDDSYFRMDNLDVSPIPEPQDFPVIALAIVALVWFNKTKAPLEGTKVNR